MQVKAQREVYSVARLNSEARQLLEAGLPTLWVEGEISNFSAPASGHWYFTLKDRDSQIRCAMFRARNSGVGFRPRDGQQLMLRGRVSLYEPRGDYQLIAEAMEDAGEGALRREFEKLKTRLAAEGLFSTDLKRPLPAMPRRIAVVTSPTGAAVRDVLHILARRFPPALVLVFPTAVQGAAATPFIVAAIDNASARGDCDVLILARGGGSIEDLWCFNDERVARAIRRCRIPVITGIGHEIDFTIADFAADVRAPTPSGAAELVVPDRRSLLATVAMATARLQAAVQRQISRAQQRHIELMERLQRAHPGNRLRQQTQRLDELDMRLRRAWESSFTRSRQRLLLAQRGLDAISPLATLDRGFAIVTRADGAVVQDAADVQPGDRIEARVARGSVLAQVTSTRSLGDRPA
ncbi:MAG: exodeoxyribonuclease VII large subunit [Steroidobacteraceae bacterium]